MYLTKAQFMNNGPLADLEIRPEFNANGSPKPLVLVGPNGSGKTNVLSMIVDALHETAAKHYSDILPAQGMGHQFFRILGGGTTRSGSAFEISAMNFSHGAEKFTYVSKAGSLAPQPRPQQLAGFLDIPDWPQDGAFKNVSITSATAEGVFRKGVYAYFPTDRNEVPYWLNIGGNNAEPEVQFRDIFVNRLDKPIVVKSSIDDINSWTADLVLDISTDSFSVVNATDLEALKRQAAPSLERALPLYGLVSVLRAILKSPQARILRTGRHMGGRKIQVADQTGRPLVRTLRELSSGQSSLLSIFATILRYGDSINQPHSAIEGIILIDEVDAHLHADLQHDVLPELMKLFPRIQFIVSSHAPLFPLGMTREFGDDGFTLVELPLGTKIDAERFSEFEKSFELYQGTKTFEQKVADTVSASDKPLILCEGETDPVYLKTAAELLGFNRLVTNVTFDWVGQKTGNTSTGAGKDNLNSAFKFLKNNPRYLRSPTVLIYDADTNKPREDFGELHIRSIPINDENIVCRGGIENLFPNEAFEERFYDHSEKRTGADIALIKKLRKTDFCRHLCEEVRDPLLFEKFREPLENLMQTLFPAA